MNNHRLYGFYYFLFSDPRTNQWWLIGSPLPGFSIIVSYLLFVLRIGPKYMQNRKPFDLKNVLIVYNFLQVLISVWIFQEVRASPDVITSHSGNLCLRKDACFCKIKMFVSGEILSKKKN